MTLSEILLGILVTLIAFWLWAKIRKPSSRSHEEKKQERKRTPYKIKDIYYDRGHTRQSRNRISIIEKEARFWEVAKSLPIEVRLRLKYVDGEGQKTERIVKVQKFGTIGSNTLISGHCSMRNATRSFRCDRIESCLNDDTGENISDVRKYLQEIYDRKSKPITPQLTDIESDALKVLLYIGKADGQLRAAEKAIIIDTLMTITKESLLSTSTIEDLLVKMKVPSLRSCKLAVGKLSSQDQQTQSIVMESAEKIVATQTTIHPNEAEALEYLKKRFN